MSASDMLCVMCSRTAFAFVAMEIPVGRARYPVCSRTECIDRVMVQATAALHRAASKSYSTGPADAIDTTASDAPPRKIATYIDASQQWIDALPDA
jgi:hypothetical protein